jgi:hypothetical protein
MPKEVPLFWINRKKMKPLIEKLLLSGLNEYHNFIDLSEWSGKFDSYLITEGALLRAELIHDSIKDD